MKQILILNETKGFNNPTEVFKSIQKINIDYTQENFLILCLNTKNELIYSEIIFKGGLNACLIDPKTLFRKALIKNSNSLIIAHNHPTNDLTPSYDDKEIYRKLKEIGDILDLKVLDSIIFNEKEFFSLKELK